MRIEIDYITNRIFNSRTYLLTTSSSDKVWLVDCGDADRILNCIGGKSIEGVFLTHTHSDHIYGLEAMLERFPTIKIYTNSFGVEALRSPQLNISRYHSEYPDISIVAPNNILVLSEGDSVEVLGFTVKVYETPGHDPSCLTYVVENNVFTGDAFIPGERVFTGFRRSDRKQAVKSVERILEISSGCQILPGHTID